MNLFIWQVLLQTPTWVFGMFATLVAVGLVQTRTAERSLLVALLPGTVLAGWSAWTTHSLFPLAPVATLAWLGGVLVAQPIGTRLLPSPSWVEPTRQRLRIPGSWLPLAMIVGVFGVRYVDNVASVIRPDLMVDTTFASVSGLVSGLVGGMFISRLVQIVRLVGADQSFEWMWSRTRG